MPVCDFCGRAARCQQVRDRLGLWWWCGRCPRDDAHTDRLQKCRLRGGTSYYLTERRLGAHLAAHRNAGHDVPEVEIP